MYFREMVTRGYDSVCWYENLKSFPETNTKGFNQCVGQAAQTQKFIENPEQQNREYMEFKEGNDIELYQDNMKLDGLPADYSSKCDKYLKNPNEAPTSDESEVIKGKNKYDYPFKALAYCLISTLREKHGEKAIDAVKNERTHKRKHWMQTLLDRENEFRARHGAEPLKLNKELMDAAQQWADKNAQECNSEHVDDKDPRGQLNGKPMGESLAANSGDDNDAVNAYVAADGWYEENKDYPWPEYKGDGNDEAFKAIGHFTASVWKGTTHVGYGYKYNKDCSEYKSYIVARYYPSGNMPGDFGKNVAPAQD